MKQFSIDGTGDPCTIKINYESKRSQQCAKKQVKKTADNSDNSNNSGNSDVVGLFFWERRDLVYSVFTVGYRQRFGWFTTSDDHRSGE